MSLVTLIRDSIDITTSTEEGYTLSSLAYHIIILLFTIVKQAVIYFFTFHWLRDLSYFCLTPPLLISSLANVNGVDDQPLHHLLAFSDFSLSTGIGIICVGFFNGCFSCIHLSATNLITIQRMLVQGAPAGICSAIGTATGQFTFLACVLFGLRGLLLPWLALEPLHFILGTGILLSVASTMALDRRKPTVQWSAKFPLFFSAFTNFVLAWCEQATLFQWMGNLTFGAEPTWLETAPSLATIDPTFGNIQQLAHNTSYLLAFFLGSILGAFIIGFFLQRFLEFILRQRGIAIYYGLVKQANLPLATLLFAFGFGSLPYYGFDYLIAKGFGFFPHEPSFQQTLFSPINLVSKTSQAKEPSQNRLEDQLALLFTLEGERSKSFVVDTTPFDDGQYLRANQKRPQSFEDLNYRGEHLWTNRLSRISNIREQANQTQSSFLGPIFSWMRAFLWGDGMTSTSSPNERSNEIVGDTSAKISKKLNDYQFIDQLVNNSSTQFVSDSKSFAPLSSNQESDKGRSASVGKVGKNLMPGGASSFVSSASEARKGQSTQSTQSIRDKKDENSITIRRKELSPEREQIDNYVKEFDRQFDKGFSNFYDTDPHSLIEVEDQWQEKRIKEKCYTNPIYKFLLNKEIDAFLARQPNSHWLSPQEEFLLLKRRQILGNYYDTLAFTNQVSTSEAFEQLVPKSYANSIYNHQFKGTLKVARRLFSIKADKLANEFFAPSGKPVIFASSAPSVDASSLVSDGQSAQKPVQGEKEKPQQEELSPSSIGNLANKKLTEYENTRVVKFDQPLFSKEEKSTDQTLFHEELNVKAYKNEDNHSFLQEETKNRKQLLTVPAGKEQSPISNNFAKSDDNNKFLVPLNVGEQKSFLPENTNIFTLEQVETSPLYAGWDNQLRKLIITNRFQNRTLAGYTFSNSPTNLGLFSLPFAGASSMQTPGETEARTGHEKKEGPLLASVSPKEKTKQDVFIDSVDKSIIDSSVNKKGSPQPLIQRQLSEKQALNKTKNETFIAFTTWPIPDPFANNVVLMKPIGSQLTTLNTNPLDDELLTKGEDYPLNIGEFSNAKRNRIGKSFSNFFESAPVNNLENSLLASRPFVSPKEKAKNSTQETPQKSLPSTKSSFSFFNLRFPFIFQKPKTHFLFQTESYEAPITNDMVNALLQWQKLIKENKQLSKEDKQAAKTKVYYWPENIHRANWSNEFVDNETELDEPSDSILKRQTFLWEFTPPYHGGFLWPGTNWKN